ncbi:1306_t:CDS:2 [Dentiscutata erythropus]|uniref:1306_t:CDS:1 n=1 Tax=Dentiscutata erythropus TaxID=1348616 RepID=A0A9N9NGB5_9GLOM|nr:1306_t:CDS:2 [Dentiscutata erythropus]
MPIHSNPTREKLRELMEGFTDTAEACNIRPFFTYSQKVKNGNVMSTRLDYIFIDDNHIQLCKKQSLSPQLGNKIQEAFKPFPASEKRIKRLNKQINELNIKIARNSNLTDLSIIATQLKAEIQDELTNLTSKW